MRASKAKRQKIAEIENALLGGKNIELNYLYFIDSDYIEEKDAVKPLKYWIRAFVLDPSFRLKVFEREDVSFYELFDLLVPVKRTILPRGSKNVLVVNEKNYRHLLLNAWGVSEAALDIHP